MGVERPRKGSKYATPEGARRLRAELDSLWLVERPAVTPAVADEPLLVAAHRRGLSVHAWFPRLEEQVEAVTASGLDGVVTDWVEEAVAARRSLEAPSG